MKKFLRFILPLLMVILIIASIGWYLFVYDRDFTRDTLLSQARYHDLSGNARLSSWFYNLAYEHSGQDENVAIELANQYKQDGNYTKAEFTLTNAINDGPTAELYTALCKTFVEQDKLLDAVTMLDNIADPAIREELNAQRPSAPGADYDPGFYSQYIDIALSSSEGKIYYTLTGEYPSTENSAYGEPISLPAGETVIYAISVADNGLVSPLSINGYTIAGVIEPAIFVDAAMEQAIRQVINADEDDILYTNNLWEITAFSVPENAAHIDDLALMPSLETLTLSEINIESLSPLANLSQLKTLDMTGCRFSPSELSILASLPGLTNLTLANCGLSTLSGLERAQNLKVLDLSGNTVRDLSPLASVTSLKELNLQHNAVTDQYLTHLSGLKELEMLDISYNALTTPAALATCSKLNWLDAGNNQLTTVDGLNNLSMLSYLSLDYNKLTNVDLLANCTELTNLSIACNDISDIMTLHALVKLDIFDFSYNKVETLPIWHDDCALRVIDGSYNALTTVDSLAKLDNIAYVYMDYNKLTNVNALGDCYHMVQVNVFGNEITDVSALTEHDIIVNYDPT